MANFYVYLHTRGDNGKVFYVGKGKGKRAWSEHSRNKYWKNIVNKHGFAVKIIDEFLDEVTAFELEELMIALIGRDNLCNMTDGGDGVSGFKFSEETKAKLSAIRKGRKRPPETGKRISEAKLLAMNDNTRLKIAESNRKRKYSDETRKKISISRSDDAVYEFRNASLALTEYCTRAELCEKYKIKPNTLNKLFQKVPNKTSQGWSLVEQGEKHGKC